MKNVKIDKALLRQELKDSCFVFVGLILYAVGWTGFLLPSEITTGGVTGIAALVFFGTKTPVAITYFCINAALLVLSIKVLGLKFSLKTIGSVAILTFLLSFLQTILKEPLVQNEPFMNCILGGVMCGMGLGLDRKSTRLNSSH